MMNTKLKIGLSLLVIIGIIIVSGCIKEKTYPEPTSKPQPQQNKTFSGTIQLELERGVEFNGHLSSFSSDGGKIFFTTDDATADIYALNLSDGEITKLIDTGVEVGFLAFDPDRKKIVFDSGGNITIINTDGSDLKVLTNTTNWILDHLDYYPRFSPDGRKILFSSDRSGAPELWTMNPDGTRIKQLTDIGYAKEGEFSPDGSKIVFVIGRDIPEKPFYVYTDVAIMNSDGTGMKILTNDTFQDNFPEFSPDGKKIVFSSKTDDGNLVIRMVNIDGSELVQLKEDYNYVSTPLFSPNGTKLAYIATHVPYSSYPSFLIIKDVKDLEWETIE